MCVKDLTRGLTSNFAASFYIFSNFYQNYWNTVFKFAIAKTAIFQGHCKWVILHCGVSGSEHDPWKKRKKECQSKIFSYVWGRKCQNCGIGQQWLFHCLGLVHPFVTACLYKLIK